MQRVFSEPAAIKLWTRLLITYAGLMLRITAANTLEEPPATPGFEVYEPGDIIIRQGDGRTMCSTCLPALPRYW